MGVAIRRKLRGRGRGRPVQSRRRMLEGAANDNIVSSRVGTACITSIEESECRGYSIIEISDADMQYVLQRACAAEQYYGGNRCVHYSISY